MKKNIKFSLPIICKAHLNRVFKKGRETRYFSNTWFDLFFCFSVSHRNKKSLKNFTNKVRDNS